MAPHNKKPGAYRRPGKVKSHGKHTRITAAQRDIHRRIEAQSEHSKTLRRHWHPDDYPDLWRLIVAAKKSTLARQRLRGRMVFIFERRRYAVRLTSLDRLIIEDHATGRFVASSGFFAL